MASERATLRPWCPPVAGVREVLHAEFPAGSHDYPMHAHDAWTLLLVDQGLVRYQLEGREHFAGPGDVTLLPPRVPHDGAAATGEGFRKRVVYLDPDVLDPALVDATVREPACPSRPLRQQVSALHAGLASGVASGVDRSATERQLVEVLAGIAAAWLPRSGPRDADGPAGGPAEGPASGPAEGRPEQLRDMLDADVRAGLPLAEAALTLGVSTSSLVHAFTRRFGMSPHRYLVSRRLDVARDLLLAGCPAAEVAVLSGFHDQAHLTRHFKRLLGLPPGAWASAARRQPAARGSWMTRPIP